MSTALEEAASRNPHWLVRTHEQLCSDPRSEFKNLYADLGLKWIKAGLSRSSSPLVLGRPLGESICFWRARIPALRRTLES
jgi:hypothetical protein